jgi:hypothetical protein
MGITLKLFIVVKKMKAKNKEEFLMSMKKILILCTIIYALPTYSAYKPAPIGALSKSLEEDLQANRIKFLEKYNHEFTKGSANYQKYRESTQQCELYQLSKTLRDGSAYVPRNICTKCCPQCTLIFQGCPGAIQQYILDEEKLITDELTIKWLRGGR